MTQTANTNNARHVGPRQASRLLARALNGAARVPGLFRRMVAMLTEILQVLAKLNQRHDEHHRDLEVMNRAVQVLCQRQDVLENASRQQAVASERYYQEQVLDPLIRLAFPLYDLIEDARRNWRVADQATADRVATLLRALRSQILEWLALYDVQPVDDLPGVVFEPQHMRAIKQVATHHGPSTLVVKCLRSGFRRDQRLLRPQLVVISRPDPASVSTTTTPLGKDSIHEQSSGH